MASLGYSPRSGQLALMYLIILLSKETMDPKLINTLALASLRIAAKVPNIPESL